MKINRIAPVFFFAIISKVYSYSYFTHYHLGGLLQDYLFKYETDIYEKYKHLDFKHLSVWADSIKRKPEYSWTKPLHYIDILECNVKNADKYCKNNCITKAITNYTQALKENNFDETSLKFLLHFAQDFSQPLHLYGFYRGGNNYRIILNKNNKNKTTNYHFLWDSNLPEYFVKNFEFEMKEIKSVNVSKNNLPDFINKILKDNLQIPCNENFFKKYVIFEEYFDEKIFIKLFENYLLLIVNIIKYINNKN